MDAKTKSNADELEKINELCNIKVTTSSHLRLNLTMATVMVPEAEFNHRDEIEPCLLEQCKEQGLPVSCVKILYQYITEKQENPSSGKPDLREPSTP